MATIDTYDRVILDMLNENSVSILKRTYANINGLETQIGQDWRVAFSNSNSGRKDITEFFGKNSPYLNAVMQVWGDTPTIIEQVTVDETLNTDEDNTIVTDEEDYLNDEDTEEYSE